MKINNNIQTLTKHYYDGDSKLQIEPFFKSGKNSKKNKSLQEFYYEIYQKSMKNIINTYNGKNASEIEAIMVENRKQIEVNKKSAIKSAS